MNSITIRSLICTALLCTPLFCMASQPLDPYVMRTIINQKMMSIEAERPEVGTVTDYTIEKNTRPTSLRVYQPKSQCAAAPVILFIHGGAWVAGNLDTHDNMARYLCQKTNAVVVSVGYLNSPEGKFPYPLEQCYDALLWVNESAEELNVNTQQLAVVGDSAGGNMAASLCLLTRDRQGPAIQLQVLVNPALDFTGANIPPGDLSELLKWYAIQYLTTPSDVFSPYASPIFATSFAKLPPALILLAEKDVLRKEGEIYAEYLTTAGVPTNVYVQWGVNHLAGNAARASEKAKESLDIAADAIKGMFRQ